MNLLNLLSRRDEDDSLKEHETSKDISLDITKDVKLECLIKEAKESIVSLNDDREKCAALARSEPIQSSAVDANWVAVVYVYNVTQKLF